jgi:hypothetical protein
MSNFDIFLFFGIGRILFAAIMPENKSG